MSASYLADHMRIGPAMFAWGARTYIMGVINVSPESFSGDGLATADAAVEQARRFIDEGADILDVGGQSTRPGPVNSDAGFDEISPEEEIRRTAPVIEQIAATMQRAVISIDTYKPDVARAAFDTGAHLLNDIDGLRLDPAMAHLVAERGLPAVVMHNQRGRPAGDVVESISQGLRESVAAADTAGIPRERLIADPGFGFGWRPEQNIEMLRRLGELRVIGMPLLIGTSRKSTIARVLGGAAVDERLFGTAATVALAIANGADIVRVHDVREMRDVVRLADAVVRGWTPEDGE